MTQNSGGMGYLTQTTACKFSILCTRLRHLQNKTLLITLNIKLLYMQKINFRPIGRYFFYYAVVKNARH